ncbi:hypothetical protein TCAL_15552 [Tigriopus californicus]|uniref:Uncharacterized protein n=1 Tax=Tigriopus californicus TaxID=6832 RepID=A0A553PU66_TIGCA|nr:hypothetical protein TCAL_15552 [Tigriopus californicus]
MSSTHPLLEVFHHPYEYIVCRFNNSKNETSFVLDMSDQDKADMALLILGSLFVGIWFKRIMFKHIRTKGKARSINRILKFDQSMNLITVFLGTCQITFLLWPQFLANALGGWICNIFEFLSMTLISYFVVGGSLIALYRTIFLYNQHWVRHSVGERNLSLLMITCTLIISIGFSMTLIICPIYERNFAHNLCTSNPHRVLRPLDEVLLGVIVRKVFLNIIGILSLIELICYLSFFVHIAKHERSVVAIFQNGSDRKKRHKRHRKTAITMFGCFLAWLIEIVAITSSLRALGKMDSAAKRAGNERLQIALPHVGFVVGSFIQIVCSEVLRPELKFWKPSR